MASAIQTGPGLRRFLPHALACVVLAADLTASATWMRSNGFFSRPPATEAAGPAMTTLSLRNTLRRDGLLEWLRVGVLTPSDHTPLFTMTASLLLAAAGADPTPAALWGVVAAFACVYAAGVWRLARNFGGPWTATAALAVAFCTPIVIVYQRPYYPQFAMAGFLPWTLDALIRSDGFRNTKRSVGFGILLGVATMMKVIAPIYVAGAAWAAMLAGLADKQARKKVAANLAAAAACAAAIVGPWFLTSRGILFAYAGLSTHSPTDPDRRTLGRWLYYPRQALNAGWGVWLIATLLIVVAALAKRRSAGAVQRTRPSPWTLVAADVTATYLLLSAGQASSFAQYLLPLGAPVAAILAAGVACAGGGRTRLILAAVVALACGRAAFDAYRPFDRDEALVTIGGVEIDGRTDHFITQLAKDWRLPPRPEAEPWPFDRFLSAMSASVRDRPPSVWTMHPYMGGTQLLMDASRRGRDLKIASTLEEADFTIVDDLIVSIEAAKAAASQLGFVATVEADEQVTPSSRVYLVRIRRS